jgi:hypothetical protein
VTSGTQALFSVWVKVLRTTFLNHKKLAPTALAAPASAPLLPPPPDKLPPNFKPQVVGPPCAAVPLPAAPAPLPPCPDKLLPNFKPHVVGHSCATLDKVGGEPG